MGDRCNGNAELVMAGVVVTREEVCIGAGFVVLMSVLVAFEGDFDVDGWGWATGAKCVVMEGVDGFGGSGKRK